MERLVSFYDTLVENSQKAPTRSTTSMQTRQPLIRGYPAMHLCFDGTGTFAPRALDGTPSASAMNPHRIKSLSPAIRGLSQ